MSLVGKTPSEKVGPDERILWAFGAASFGYDKKSKHRKLEEYLHKNLTSLGYKVRYYNEYYSSQKCPRTGCHEQTIEYEKRVKVCTRCCVVYDRDDMAAQNMANLGQQDIKVNGTRCLYLDKRYHEYLGREGNAGVDHFI